MNVFASPWYPSMSPAFTVPEVEHNNIDSNINNNKHIESNFASTDTLHYTTNSIELIRQDNTFAQEERRIVNIVNEPILSKVQTDNSFCDWHNAQVKCDSEIVENTENDHIIENNCYSSNENALCNMQRKESCTYADYKASTVDNGIDALEYNDVNACQHTRQFATMRNVEERIAITTSNNDNAFQSCIKRSISLHGAKDSNAVENKFAQGGMTSRVNNDMSTMLPEVNAIKNKTLTYTNLEKIRNYEEAELMHFDSSSESSEGDCMLLPTCAYTSPQLRNMSVAQQSIENDNNTIHTEQKQTKESLEEYQWNKPNVAPYGWTQQRTYQSENGKPCLGDNQHSSVDKKELEEREKKPYNKHECQIIELTCTDTNMTYTKELEKTINSTKSTEISKMHKSCNSDMTVTRSCSNGQASNETSKSHEGTSTSQDTDSFILSTPSCYTHNPYSWMSSETVHSPANEFSQMWYTAENEDTTTTSAAAVNQVHNNNGIDTDVDKDDDNNKCANACGKTVITVMENWTAEKNVRNDTADAPIQGNSQLYNFTQKHAENISFSSPTSLEAMLNLTRRCTENTTVAPINTFSSNTTTTNNNNNTVTSASSSAVGMTLQEVEAQLLQHTYTHSSPILHSTCPLTDAVQLAGEWSVQEGSDVRPIHFSSFIPESLRSGVQILPNYTSNISNNLKHNKERHNAHSLHYPYQVSSIQKNLLVSSSSSLSSSLLLVQEQQEICSNPLHSQSSLSASEKCESSSKWFSPHSSSSCSTNTSLSLRANDNSKYNDNKSQRELARRRNRNEKFIHCKHTEDADNSRNNYWPLSSSQINDTASNFFNSSSLNLFAMHTHNNGNINHNTNDAQSHLVNQSNSNSRSWTTVPLPRSRQSMEYDLPTSLNEKGTVYHVDNNNNKNDTCENSDSKERLNDTNNCTLSTTEHAISKQSVSAAVKVNDVDCHDEYADDTYTSLALSDSVSSQSFRATATPHHNKQPATEVVVNRATKQEQENECVDNNKYANRNKFNKTKLAQGNKAEYILSKRQTYHDGNENNKYGIKNNSNATSIIDKNEKYVNSKNNGSKGEHTANTASVNGAHEIAHVETNHSTKPRNTHRKTSDGWVIVEDHNMYPNKRRTDARHYTTKESSKANKVDVFTYVTKYNLVTAPTINKTKVQRSNDKNTTSATLSTNKKTDATTTITNNNYGKSNKNKDKSVNNKHPEREFLKEKEEQEREEERDLEEKYEYQEEELEQEEHLHEKVNTEVTKEEDAANAYDTNNILETIVDAKEKLDVNECLETKISASNANDNDNDKLDCLDNTITKNSRKNVQYKKSNKKANITNNSNAHKTSSLSGDKLLEVIINNENKERKTKNKHGNGDSSNNNNKKKVSSTTNKSNANALDNKKKEKVHSSNKIEKQQEQQEEQQTREKGQKQSTLQFAQVNSYHAKPVFCVMGIPIEHYTSIEDVIEHDLRQYSQENQSSAHANGVSPSNTADSSNGSSNHVKMKKMNNKSTINVRSIPAQVRSIASYVHRCHALEDSANAKGLFVQRALNLLSEFVLKHFPRLVCVVLLEGSDCFADMERMLQCCQQAMELSEQHHLPIMQMLAKLSMTRTLARIIDITNAKEHLMDAMKLAMKWHEMHTLAWIAMQMGVTRELSGHFGSSLKWYSLSEQLAMCTLQPRLLCDVHLCKAIACYAVGEKELADEAYHNATVLLSTFPPLWRICPLQSYAQVKLQSGDLHSALALHKEELQLATMQNDLTQISRCMSSIALALKYLGCYDEAIQMYTRELATCNAYNINTTTTTTNMNNNSVDERQAVESLLGASLCYMLKGNGYYKAMEFANRALKEAQRCNEYCTLAKALVQLADVVSYCCYNTHELLLLSSESSSSSLSEEKEELSRALEFLFAAMTAMARVDHVEKQQYLIKATLCELEWRCCGTFVRLIIQHNSSNNYQHEVQEDMKYTNIEMEKETCNPHISPWNALLYCDVCNIPNTADIRGLLRRQRKRRVRRFIPHNAITNSSSKKATINITTTTTKATSTHNTMTANHSLQIDHDAICNYFGLDLVNRENIIALLKEPIMAGRKLVCYSLPWTEESLCVAFVIELCVKPTEEHYHNNDHDSITDALSAEKSLSNETERKHEIDMNSEESNKEYDLRITPFTLTLSSELVYLLVNHNALNDVFDLNDVNSDSDTATHNNTNDKNSKLDTNTTNTTCVDVSSEMNYGDTPLWPQHYSKMAFEYEHNNSETCQQSVKAIQSNPLYCLQVLHKALLQPLESILQYNIDGSALNGVTFIGDGIFTRIPFHALHDGAHFFVEKYNITTCSSLALLETLYLTSQTELSCCNSSHASQCTTSPSTTMTPHDENNSNNNTEETSSHIHGIVTLIDTSSVNNNNNTLTVHQEKESKANDVLVSTIQPNQNDDNAMKSTNWSVHHVTLCEDAANNNDNKVKISGVGTAECASTQNEVVQTAKVDVINTESNNKSNGSAESNQDVNREMTLTTLVEEVKEELMKINATYRDKQMSNQLYSTVHDIQQPNVPCAHILKLHLPVVPETREDYCGYFTSVSREPVIIAHAADIATTWNLTAYDLVICSACGTYAGLSFHETGIPVYRALMYAGATRLLLPIGTRLTSMSDLVQNAAIQATVNLYDNNRNNKEKEKMDDRWQFTDNYTEPNVACKWQTKRSVAQTIREVQCEMIKNGASLREWATYTLCGLP